MDQFLGDLSGYLNWIGNGNGLENGSKTMDEFSQDDELVAVHLRRPTKTTKNISIS